MLSATPAMAARPSSPSNCFAFACADRHAGAAEASNFLPACDTTIGRLRPPPPHPLRLSCEPDLTDIDGNQQWIEMWMTVRSTPVCAALSWQMDAVSFDVIGY